MQNWKADNKELKSAYNNYVVEQRKKEEENKEKVKGLEDLIRGLKSESESKILNLQSVVERIQAELKGQQKRHQDEIKAEKGWSLDLYEKLEYELKIKCARSEEKEELRSSERDKADLEDQLRHTRRELQKVSGGGTI